MADLKTRLAAFLQDRHPQLSNLGDNEYFADHDALSSLQLLQLVLDLEQHFGFRVQDDEMTEDNIGSKANLLTLLQRKMAGQETAS